MINLYVSKTNADKNHFCSLSEAIASIPADTGEPVTVFLEAGIYHEKVTIQRPFITLIGESAETTIITYDDCAKQLMPDGSRKGTFRSYTMFLDSHNITLTNLTVRNASFPRSRAGQAIALYADGDRILVKNCRLESYQDTLFTGPLPPAPLSPGGFTGPKEFARRIVGRQCYEDCYICGDVDFIFGSATAYFERCEIASVASEVLAPDSEGNTAVYGYATAASTPEGYPYGYVFHNCRFTGTVPDRSVYLGRPWRDYARTVLLSCYLGPHIRPEGFHDWNKPDARENCFYAEYQSYGPGAAETPSCRAPYVHQLTAAKAAYYTKEKVLNGTDGWCP